jgi:hypothetical protein
MTQLRACVVSSFTIIKGSLIEETHEVMRGWDFGQSKFENLRQVREMNSIGLPSANWARDVAKVMNRRFQPDGRDRPLTELAQAGVPLETWKPLLLWHMTRDEFLLRDFLINWLYARFTDGTFRLHSEDVLPYLGSLAQVEDIQWSGNWSSETTSRVASGLLRMATDFGLLRGTQTREFASYHLPDESLLYLLYALQDVDPTPRKMIDSTDWHMFLMDAEDVERELLRLHQFHKLHYDVAGSIVHLRMQHASLDEYVEELCS